MDAVGLITIPSVYTAKETMDRVQAEVKSRGMSVFARVDHAAGAQQAGLALRPTELLVFGAAKGGTPLMQQAQTAGIDLPLKMLGWEDAGHRVWLSYNDPAWIASRHGIGDAARPVVEALTTLLTSIGRAAAGAA